MPTVQRDVTAEVDGRRFSVRLWVPDLGPRRPPPAAPGSPEAAAASAVTGSGSGQVTVPMQGTIVKVLVAVGDVVEVGQAVCLLEAMKMENAVAAEKDGVIKEVRVERGRLRGCRRHRGGHRVGERRPGCRCLGQGRRGSRHRRRTWVSSSRSATRSIDPRAVLRGDGVGAGGGRDAARRRARSRRGRLRPADRPRVTRRRGRAGGGGMRRVRRVTRRGSRLRAQHHRGHRGRRGPGARRGGGRHRAHRAGAGHPGGGGRRRQDPDARARRLRGRPRRHDGPPLADRAADRHLPGGGALRRPLRGTGRPTRRPPPGKGVNAQDALTVAQVAIGLLRQQLPPGDQVHGVVTHSSAAANVIPAAITARYMVRSRTAEGLAALRPRVDACFQAGRVGLRLLGRLRGACARVLAHGGRPGPAARPTAPTPRHSDGTSTPTMPARRSRRSPPTWRTCRWRCPPSTRSSG